MLSADRGAEVQRHWDGTTPTTFILFCEFANRERTVLPSGF
jgi:hypothetical protein